jgi:uncharacterized protein YjbJ (UPF0337 family)
LSGFSASGSASHDINAEEAEPVPATSCTRFPSQTAEQSHEAEGCRADFRDNNVTTRGVEPMNWDRVEGNWKTFKGQVQQKWGKLTDDDLDVIEGKRTELAGRLQQRYGYAKDEAEKNIDSWLKNIH